MDIVIQLTINSIIAGSLYALVAVSFSLIYGVTKFFNLTHGTIAVIGGYAVLVLYKTWGLSLFFSVSLGIIIAGLAGYILDKTIYLSLRKRKASNMVLLVASLGAFTAIQAVIAIFFTSQFQVLSTTGEIKIFHIFGGVMTVVQVLILISAIVATAGIKIMLKYSKLGKATKAISDDEEVAKMVGINTDKIIGYIFFLGSMVAGLAGILIGFDTGLEPTLGLSVLLKGIIASIVGGVGSVGGGFLGGFILGFVENFGIWKISGEWKDAISFLLLIIFLVFRPKGLIKK